MSPTYRPIGALRHTIAGAWNLDFTPKRRDNIKRLMRQRLRCNPKGKGNKAWKRVERLDRRELGTLIWPNYCLSNVAGKGISDARQQKTLTAD